MGHILVLRTEPEATKMVAELEQLGHQAVACSLLNIEPLPLPTEQLHYLQQLALFDDIIVTSTHAASFLVAWVQKHYDNPLPAKTQWYAMGSGSATALGSIATKITVPTDARTEGLLELPAMKQPAGRKILLVKGEGGRTTLTNTLSQYHADISTLSLYRRIPNQAGRTKLPQLLLSSWDAVLASSGETVQALAEVCDDHYPACPLLVPSIRVQGIASSLGFTSIEVVGNVSTQTAHQWLTTN